MNSARGFPVFFLLISVFLSLNHSISFDNDEDYAVLQQRLRQRVPCHNKLMKQRMYQKGKFWVVQNFAMAEHMQIDCHSAVTLVTISDINYLDNLVPLVRRWRAPISLALYAPGDDLQPTIDSIKYLRNCLRNQEDINLIRQFVNFHLYFDAEHITQWLPRKYSESRAYCEKNPMKLSEYRTTHNLSYYINVPRNAARDAALTHFVFHTDIELYPSENLALKFLRMIAMDERPLNAKQVYVVPAFEVKEDAKPPSKKRDLIAMLHNGTAVEFHVSFCEHCAKVPQIDEWKAIPDSDDLKILTTVKRIGAYNHWEPFFIGPAAMPYYEERSVYEGKSDRMTQLTMLCLLDYDFSVLDNVFLAHRPGIKLGYPKEGKAMRAHTRKMITEKWIPEYVSLYGPRKGCHL